MALYVLTAVFISAGIGCGVITFVVNGAGGLSAAIPDGVPRTPLWERGSVRFDRALRGYDTTQVDAYLASITDPSIGVPLRADVARVVANKKPIFRVVFRGYRMQQVDEFLTISGGRLAEVNNDAGKLPKCSVQFGDETS